MSKKKPAELDRYKKALRDLVDGCGCVSVLTGQVHADTVLQMRAVMKLLAAYDAAKDLLDE